MERWNESDEVVSQDQSLKATQVPEVLDRFQAIVAQVEELNVRQQFLKQKSATSNSEALT